MSSHCMIITIIASGSGQAQTKGPVVFYRVRISFLRVLPPLSRSLTLISYYYYFVFVDSL